MPQRRDTGVVPVVGMSSLRLKDQDRNRDTVVELLRPLTGEGLTTILDIRYGLGDFARTVCTLFPAASYHGVECDESTYRAAWHPPRGELLHAYYTAQKTLPPHWPTAWHLLLGDFSNVTRLNRVPVVEAAEQLLPRYFLFGDVGCMRLHLHWLRYGCKSCDLEDYWEGWGLPGYTLLGWRRAHARCSFSLWERRE